MSNGNGGGGGGAGKIILIVVGVLLLIGLVCCGAGYFFVLKPGVDIGMGAASFQEAVSAKYGDIRMQQLPRNGQQDIVFAVGFPEGQDLSPEAVVALQDDLWTMYTQSFSDSGFPFCRAFAVGIGRGDQPPGWVEGWQEHVVEVTELVQRTGIPAPPPSKLEKLGRAGQVEIEATPDEK